MTIETNDSTARRMDERVTLATYKAMAAVNAEAKILSGQRIATLLRSILHEIERHGSPYAETVEKARAAMDAADLIAEQSYRLAMHVEIVPDDQLELPLECSA